MASLTNNWLTQWIAGWFGSRRSQTFLFGTGTREVMPDINAATAITEGFDSNDAVYSITMKDARKFASIPRYLFDVRKLNKAYSAEAKLTNELSKLLDRPNPNEGRSQFLKHLRAGYKITGEYFIWLNRGDTEGLTDAQRELKPVLQMYALPPQYVNIIPDPEDVFNYVGIVLKINGLGMPIRKVDIIHGKDTMLDFDGGTRVHLRGMPPLRPGASTLQQNNDATNASVRMFQNDGAKAVIYNETFDAMTPTQQTQIQSVIDRKINNNDIKGAVATLQGKWGLLDLSKGSTDLDLLSGKRQSWQDLCAVLDVPYLLFDPSATYANLESAKKNWINDSILPACQEFDDELNRRLLRAFGLEGKAIIISDASELPEMQQNMKETAEWVSKMKNNLTKNEIRDLIGFEARPEPEFDEVWIEGTELPLSKVLNPDDGLDAYADELGLADYSVPPKEPKSMLNGTKV